MTKPKAYSYIRFSTPEQERGDSLRRQVEYSQQVAAKLGLELDDHLRLTDRGISAFRGDHRTKGTLGAFLSQVEAGKIKPGSVLIIEALDRLSREGMLEAVHLLTGILLKGINLHTAIDNKHFQKSTYDLADLIISATKLQQGHEESEKKSERLKAAWNNKRAQARSAQRKILAGKGTWSIESALNQQKVWKPKNGWRKSYINKILRNPAVHGEFQPHKKIDGKRVPEGEPIVDYYPPIIERSVFDRVQGVIQENRQLPGHAGGRNGAVSNLFGHIAVCGKCGGPMSFVHKGKPPKGGQYLQCDRARRGLGCTKTLIRYDKIEPLLLTFCKGLNPEDILPDNEQRQSELSILQNQLQAWKKGQTKC